jgi:Na+/H+-dicarboxylate symporter
VLAVVGQAFIDLLQMTILPYITAALVLNIGRLSRDRARRLAGSAGLVLLGLWAVALAVVVAAPQGFPDIRQGAFFSAEAIQPAASFDPLEVYIPDNPFHSLANNVVPAVVLFSICLGVALIGIERKQTLLDVLDTACQALTRVSALVVRLTPYGIFAIAAAAAGTITLDELARLRGYLIAYTASGLLLAFVVLPLLVSALTPFSYRQVVGVSRDAVVTAFATGKLFVVLPLIIEASHRLLRELDTDSSQPSDTASVLVPLAYPFPSAGKLLILLFIPFAAWYVGSPLSMGRYPTLIGVGLLGLFGSPLATVPYLLDLFRLPADMFNLFIISGVWSTRVSDAVGAMHLLAFSVLAGCAVMGAVRVQVQRLAWCGVAGVALVALGVAGLSGYLAATAPDPALGSERIVGMSTLRDTVRQTVLDEAGPNPVTLRSGQSALSRIRERGVVRVGFDEYSLPFAFFNSRGELVGFDIEMAHRLAGELEVAIEFVPCRRSTLARQLEDDHFDLVMSGIAGTFETLRGSPVARSGIELTGALVVADHLRDEYGSVASIRSLGNVRIGTVGLHHISDRFRQRFPSVELVPFDSHREFFEGSRPDVSALITTAEEGSAWTLVYPSYQVVVPTEVPIALPLVYPVRAGDVEFRRLIEDWAALVAMDGTADELYDHWILGGGAETTVPRWSVIRNVLHWVE